MSKVNPKQNFKDTFKSNTPSRSFNKTDFLLFYHFSFFYFIGCPIFNPSLVSIFFKIFTPSLSPSVPTVPPTTPHQVRLPSPPAAAAD